MLPIPFPIIFLSFPLFLITFSYNQDHLYDFPLLHPSIFPFPLFFSITYSFQHNSHHSLTAQPTGLSTYIISVYPGQPPQHPTLSFLCSTFNMQTRRIGCAAAASSSRDQPPRPSMVSHPSIEELLDSSSNGIIFRDVFKWNKYQVLSKERSFQPGIWMTVSCSP